MSIVPATGIATTFAGASDTFGYDGHFLLAAALCVVALFAVWRLFLRTAFPSIALPHAEVRT